MSDLINCGMTMWEKSRVMIKMFPRVNKAMSIREKQVQAEETGYRGGKVRSTTANRWNLNCQVMMSRRHLNIQV